MARRTAVLHDTFVVAGDGHICKANALRPGVRGVLSRRPEAVYLSDALIFMRRTGTCIPDQQLQDCDQRTMTPEEFEGLIKPGAICSEIASQSSLKILLKSTFCGHCLKEGELMHACFANA